MIKIIALDMDGTLLHDHKCVSETNKAALLRAASMGIEIVAATGRPYNALTKDFMALPGTRYIIASNGAIIWDRKEERYIRRSYLSREQTILLYNEIGDLRDKDVWEEVCVSGRSYAPKWQFNDVHQYAVEDITAEYLKSTRTPVDNLGEFILNCEDEIERISCFSEDIDFLADLRKRIEYIPDIMSTQAQPRDLEIGHSASSKGQALKYLADYLDVDQSEVMSFGDGMNDLDMVAYAGIGVAMENAYDEVKDVAFYITDHCEADGVAKAINKFL